jgi:hypothetical protein
VYSWGVGKRQTCMKQERSYKIVNEIILLMMFYLIQSQETAEEVWGTLKFERVPFAL